MATEPAPETETATKTKLKLDPPEALQPVAPAEAAGLVPLKSEETSELDKRVAQFVDELTKLDSNSPEFGKKVDQLTAPRIGSATGRSRRSTRIPASARTWSNFGEPSNPSTPRRRRRPGSCSGSSRSATASTVISTSTGARKRTFRRSSAASRTARTSC